MTRRRPLGPTASDGCLASKRTSILPPVSEEEIQTVLESTGKADPEQQLNCGACGYATLPGQGYRDRPGHGGDRRCASPS